MAAFVDVRDVEKQALMRFLQSPNGFVHLCGRPGTGKTMLVQHLLETEFPDEYLYLSCVGSSSENIRKTVDTFLNEISESGEIKNKGKRLRTCRKIVVLDEINYLSLVDQDGDTLTELIRAVSADTHPWCIVAISNQLGQEWTINVQDIDNLRVHPDINFPVYTSCQLGKIAESWRESFEPCALKWIVANTSAQSGDARILVNTVTAALFHQESRPITMKTAQHVVKTLLPIPTNEIISALPLNLKMLLAVCIRLQPRAVCKSGVRFDLIVTTLIPFRKRRLYSTTNVSTIPGDLDLLSSCGLVSIYGNPSRGMFVKTTTNSKEFENGLDVNERLLFGNFLTAEEV
jgi:Cdc6-like AAA superfamily ATPase